MTLAFGQPYRCPCRMPGLFSACIGQVHPGKYAHSHPPWSMADTNECRRREHTSLDLKEEGPAVVSVGMAAQEEEEAQEHISYPSVDQMYQLELLMYTSLIL